MTPEALARALFDAFTAGDAAAATALLSEDFAGIQNGGPVMDGASLIAFSVAVKKVVPDFHYEEVRCEATASGFVEEHLVCGTLPDGSALKLPACVVGEVAEGQIRVLREYLDSRQATGLLKALAG